MKTTLLTILCLLGLHRATAGTSLLPEIPPSKLTIPAVLAIAQKRIPTNTVTFTNCCVIAINWCKASDFQPRLGDAHWSPGFDDPEKYCWFVTYLYRDLEREKTDRQFGSNPTRQFNSCGVIRVKDDGTIGQFIGFQ
jgi:hypothetical protein